MLEFVGQPALWSVVFVVSLLVLIRASRSFTRGAEALGVYLGIPPFIVGVTIVAIGTSFPELMSSVYAVMVGHSEIVVGNVLGSNITNVFLVLGVSAIVAGKISTRYNLVRVDLPLFVASAFFLAACLWDGAVSLVEGLLCLAGFVLYLLYTIRAGQEAASEEGSGGSRKGERRTRRKLKVTVPVTLVLSAAFIYLGARYTIESLVRLSGIFNIATEVISASAVALGTSLPELVVSISALKDGNREIVIGNVLGSNIFNAFAVTGVAVLFGQVIVPDDMLTLALPMMVMATLLYLFMTQDKQITRWEGSVLLIFYVFFIGKLFELL